MATATRRKRRSRQHWTGLTRRQRDRARVVLFWLVPLAGAAWLWLSTGRPGAATGLAALAASFVVLWPPVSFVVEYGLPALALRAVPRPWRQARHDRRGRPRVPWWLKRGVRAAYLWRCASCGARRGPFEYDHLWPFVKGGTTDLFNMVLLCRTCNRVKSDWSPGDEPLNARAQQIYDRELIARREWWRWVIVAWLLALS